MSTERCTSLVLKGLYYNFDEMWIVGQPLLITCHIYDHFPWLGRQMLKYLLGPMRVGALRDGRSMFNVIEMFYHLMF